jgi:hypothetical protein
MASKIVRQDSSIPTNVHAAIYARVSTLNGNQDPSMQTRELEEYCERRGWQVFDSYVDISVGKVFAAAQSVRILFPPKRLQPTDCFADISHCPPAFLPRLFLGSQHGFSSNDSLVECVIELGVYTSTARNYLFAPR